MFQLTDWSYSRYSTWKKCPAQLKFSMTIPGERITHPAAKRGQDLHKSVELFLLGKADLPMELAYYQDFLTHLRNDGAQPELPIALTADWQPTEWDAKNRWWRGILDCVIESDDLTCIYDWKTGNEYADHREQREIYAAAHHALRDVPYVRVFHVYLDKKQNTTTLFHRDEIKELREDWANRIREMFNDKHFAPNPGFHCRSCQYRAEAGGPCPF